MINQLSQQTIVNELKSHLIRIMGNSVRIKLASNNQVVYITNPYITPVAVANVNYELIRLMKPTWNNFFKIKLSEIWFIWAVSV